MTVEESVVFFNDAPSSRFLLEKVDRLPISADAKALLMDLAELTVLVGGKVLAFGRKLLSLIFELATRFQNVLFGTLIALVLSAVIATFPVLGPSVSALLTPIMLAFGVSKGAIEDFRNMAVQREIDGLKQRMEILATYA